MSNNYAVSSTFLMTAKIVSYMIILQNILVFIIDLNDGNNVVMVNLNNYNSSNKLLLDPELQESNILRFTDPFTNFDYNSNVFIPLFYKGVNDTLYNNIVSHHKYNCNMSDELLNCMTDTCRYSSKREYTPYINDGYKYWDCYNKKVDTPHYNCVKAFLDIAYNKTSDAQLYKMLSIYSSYCNNNIINTILNFSNKFLILAIVTFLELCGSYIILSVSYLAYKLVVFTYTVINSLINTQSGSNKFNKRNNYKNTNDPHIKNN